jgi:hypothetical protein
MTARSVCKDTQVMNKEAGRVEVSRIVSGGQAGADRAAFDFAFENGIEIGGFVPHGRLAEDGPINAKYPNLLETNSSDPFERTRLNVESGDATLIVSRGPLAGGSRFTLEFALETAKPVLHINLYQGSSEDAAIAVREWLIENRVRILNVAGPRSSEDPGIYSAVKELLTQVWKLK